MRDKILVTKSSMPEFDEYIEEIKDLWDSHWLTNSGCKHVQLEQKLKKYLNVKNLVLFTNGHLALENIIDSFDLSGEVITTPFTFISTTNAIIRNGLTPVFCDINYDDYTIDAKKIESLITKKTTAIVPVHVYGSVCNCEAIDKIAKKYNLKVVYDAAHAFGVFKNKKSIANYGDASIFSFHATKVFNTIEGGAAIFKDESYYDKLTSLKNFGINTDGNCDYIGGNAKMNEFQAAMGICNLRHINEEIVKRKKVFERYIQRLSNIQGIKLSNSNSVDKQNYAYFPIVFENYKYNREQVEKLLLERNIFARRYFFPLTSEVKPILDKFVVQETPIAKYVSERVLSLPLYADLKLEDVDMICDIILN
ncbi:DegT/DnrJ/EryC1/StrS family aminotransferase [Sedimentibacter sp. zth1]|uniref:DegT/DnrJ/EryC1/StrS family aminotransferase n=1 Tax=Sedimentibacter sp. zth1 TaxID=2816908 RepID=UPI001A914B3E|nr:DegT/DnrJ/EryC1/StrS family aminotransferase [Sedimentibacter sp. zth1]QSX07159.1 DegT/DnrJ/EryC1/StrS family aminotransferase [Sedimentibacter sp. zth1]